MEKRIAIVFGTRPEIIKFSSIIKHCREQGIGFFTVHTGQHYSREMGKIFFEQLGLPEPDFRLSVKSSAPFMQGEHTGKMMQEIEKLLLREKPTDVLVEGDTNTVLAGALVTAKIATVKQLVSFRPRLGHVEACLRSYDRSMPEETNRVIADHVSDLLFAPTEQARENGLKESIAKEKIFVTGNTIVDALQMVEKRVQSGNALEELKLRSGRYALLTLHRQENVDVRERLHSILKGVSEFSRKHGIKVVWPVHPRTKKMLGKFSIAIPKEVRAVKPLGFLEFLQVEKNAAIVLTDSGGVQEESCIFRVPCVTLRENTERPETVQVGANIVAGWKPEGIAEAAEKMLSRKRKWQQPFGNGKAGKKIIDIVLRE
ncbi:MAG: UDP-N-acetylglucosamine 2-epimerase (non-hydrolyzing) [Candidatus Diapherotrites archaeon]|uniref:UDP-N-acetylglucosamine 2-epimerase (Non-hydrolyzing) n=1 Tax=Candidatus Iainarchaeum sp. TaxID=3101447 RepID=A0A938YYK2_9ARCH|nr:UDP-N-acetylglucosamine 2-epimerase (non-hydrolyzing) [Candidatus Diapherotrites archaeon]